MQVILLILAIGVLNLGLGYAAAVHLGYGPPTLRDAWMALSALPRARDAQHGVGRPVSTPLPQFDPIPGLAPDPIADSDRAPDPLDAWLPTDADGADGAFAPSQPTAPNSMPLMNADRDSSPVPIEAEWRESEPETSETSI